MQRDINLHQCWLEQLKDELQSPYLLVSVIVSDVARFVAYHAELHHTNTIRSRTRWQSCPLAVPKPMADGM